VGDIGEALSRRPIVKVARPEREKQFRKNFENRVNTGDKAVDNSEIAERKMAANPHGSAVLVTAF
jgi:hypothetical protein